MLGCAGNPTAPVPVSLSLASAQRKWKAARLQNYSFVSSVSCYCLPDYAQSARTFVTNGVVTSVVDLRTGATLPPGYRFPIDSLFDKVRIEIALRPQRLRITFDEKLGFPSSLTYGTPENDGGGTIFVEKVIRLP